VNAEFVLREPETERDLDAAAALMTEYLAWGTERLSQEYGIDGPPTSPDLIRASLGEYRSPVGLLVLAEVEGEPVGVGALHLLSADVAEVKRMYVAPRARGLHIGSAILDGLLQWADAKIVPLVRLDSARFMDQAHALYLSRGFVERAPYSGSEIPPDIQQYWRFFERLTPVPA
jgi:GNAT superfamily N-acetyltransferase